MFIDFHFSKKFNDLRSCLYDGREHAMAYHAGAESRQLNRLQLSLAALARLGGQRLASLGVGGAAAFGGRPRFARQGLASLGLAELCNGLFVIFSSSEIVRFFLKSESSRFRFLCLTKGKGAMCGRAQNTPFLKPERRHVAFSLHYQGKRSHVWPRTEHNVFEAGGRKCYVFVALPREKEPCVAAHRTHNF